MYIGITAEWNPFHQGHEKLIKTLKTDFPGAPVVCAMSGAFVQRGEPAVFEKWDRAVWAIRSGIDLAVELPAVCVLQSADRFAEFGALLLSDLGCTHLAFGAESLSAADFYKIADWSLSASFSRHLHTLLKEGLPYSSAVNRSIEMRFPEYSADLTRPNNLLGIQYTRTIRKYRLPMEIIAVRRDTVYQPISASAIREEIRTGQRPSFIPAEEEESLVSLIRCGRYTDYRRYDDICLAAFRCMEPEQLLHSGLFSEGLENKWHKEISCRTYSEMLAAVKNKRYLYSRLRRIGASLLLSQGLTPSPMSRFRRAPFARLLAMRKSGSPLLRLSRLPIITSFARAEKAADAPVREMLLIERRASDMQALCFTSEKERAGRQDYYHSPVVL